MATGENGGAVPHGVAHVRIHAPTSAKEPLTARILNRRSIVFLISDFFDQDYERTLRILSRRHDLIAVSVNDPREYELPDVGLLDLEDAETGAITTVDTGSAAVRAPWSLLAYAAALVMIVALCASEAGPLLSALLVYAGALVTTSVLAWGAGPVAGIGGVVFLASDAMIGLRAFAPSFDPPQEGFLIMSTYIAAQVLLAHAVAQHAQPGRAGTRTPLLRARAAR